MIWGKLPILQWLYLGIPGEERQALLLQIHCHSIGGNAHTQGIPAAPSGAVGQRDHHFRDEFWQATFPTSHKVAGPKLDCPPAPCQWRSHPNMEWATTRVLITYPSQIPDQTPSTSIALNGVHCLAMLMPSRGLRSFLSCGYHRVVSCCSLCSRGGAGTLINSRSPTFVVLLKPPRQQWKSLSLLSMQKKRSCK